jgi:diaminopimelate epimerase
MIPFTKMHGLGNDFIVLDEFDSRVPPDFFKPERARFWCDRRLGVGADQILVIGRPSRTHAIDQGAQARMDIWNADGSTAEMCGNGIRAVALYLHDHAPMELRGRPSYKIETGAGVLEVSVHGRAVRVDMGAPRLLADAPEALRLESEGIEFWEVNMGNPHAVIFVPDVSKVDLEKLGPQIEKHARFPKRTNVEFVQVVSKDEILVRVWERGAGVTLACGTGACASAVAAIHSRQTGHVVRVRLPGGVLELAWDGSRKDSVWMTGPAVEVYQGLF